MYIYSRVHLRLKQVTVIHILGVGCVLYMFTHMHIIKAYKSIHLDYKGKETGNLDHSAFQNKFIYKQ